jgi:diguanylate cyclase (GGDEF)-like protein/PAS domain S-box-containing protein
MLEGRTLSFTVPKPSSMKISSRWQQVFKVGSQIHQWWSKYWQQGLALSLATLVVFMLWQTGVGQSLENWSYNVFLQWRGAVPWSQSIAVVEIDEASLRQLRVSPWSRPLYAALIDRLAAADPAVIALNTLFAGAEPEDADLATAMAHQGRVVLAQAWDANNQPVLSNSILIRAASAIGHIDVAANADGVTRVTTKINGIPALGVAAAQIYTSQTNSAAPIQPPTQIWLNPYFQPPVHYPIAAVLTGEVPLQQFRNKIVLVGLVTADASSTSLQRLRQSVYLQATLIGNLLQHSSFVQASRFKITAALLVVNVILLGGTANWRWFYQLLLWLGIGWAWAWFSWLEFIANIWLPTAMPIVWFSLTGAILLLAQFVSAFQSLQRNEARYALMMQGFNAGVWDWDLNTNRFYFSPRWKQMIGCEEEISERPQEWLDRVHPLDRPDLEAAIANYLQGTGSHFECEYRLLHGDGTYHWMQSRGLAVYNSEGSAERLIGSQTDITAQKQAEEELWRSTVFDRLTGLPSWTGFVNSLQQAINQSQQDSRPRFAILWLDLDQFKLINNSMGSSIGDRLLVAIAQRLKAFLSPNEVVARLGEDEFAILLESIQDANGAIHIAEQIQQVLACPFKLDDHEIFVTASIGIALSASHYQKPEHLLRDAGTAMYRAKAMGRASYLVFDKSMRTGMLVKLRLENDLRRAIAEGERQSEAIVAIESQLSTALQSPTASPVSDTLVTQPDTSFTVTSERYPELELYYQPIVRLSSKQVTGFEALVRWQHAEQGLLFPSRFISMAEETGLIIPLSWWVLRTACRQMSQWRRLFPEKSALTMSVNLSSKQFSMPGLTERIQQILQETELEPTYLKLELTESMVIENVTNVMDVLYQLRALGIRLAIDDFGTGYSSLSYLPRFPLTTLKIDRSFVNRIDDCNDNLEIVRTILALARNLRMDVVAEGVETEAQATRLREMGCEYGQGFFFYKPMDVESATHLLSKQLALVKQSTADK